MGLVGGEDLANESVPLGMGVKLLAGGASGVTAASATYPLDLVRTRLAAQVKTTEKGFGEVLGV